jgi:hypothetical protein
MNVFNADFNALQWTVGPTSDDLFKVGLEAITALPVHCELMCKPQSLDASNAYTEAHLNELAGLLSSFQPNNVSYHFRVRTLQPTCVSGSRPLRFRFCLGSRLHKPP